MMIYRPLGKTGVQVPAIGMGCWAIGGDAWGPVAERDAIAAIRQSLDLGANLFDTADVYGRGRSEEILAGALAAVPRAEVILAGKVGLWFGLERPNKYTRPELVVEHCQASLRRLRTDYLDIYQCHVFWNENTEIFAAAFARLKEQGKIRFCGVSTNELATVQAFHRAGVCDVVQLDYSILHRAPEKELLPYCGQHGIGVLVRGPLRRGLLTGKLGPETTFPPGDIRHNWPAEAWYASSLDVVARLQMLLGRERILSQVALAFVLRRPEVSAAIPGAKNAGQAAANIAAAGVPLTDADLEMIEKAVAGIELQ